LADISDTIFQKGAWIYFCVTASVRESHSEIAFFA
jgi:hypothetical protein